MAVTKSTVVKTPTLGLDKLCFDKHLFVKTPNNTIYRIRKERNEDEEGRYDPRTNKNNLGTMYCWYKLNEHYHLCDYNHNYLSPDEFIYHRLFDIIAGEPYFCQPVFDFVESGKASLVRFDMADEKRPGRLVAYSRLNEYSEWKYYKDIAWPAPFDNKKERFARRVAEWLTSDEIKAILDGLPELCIMPLYILDFWEQHRFSVSVNSFNDPWDSCRPGWIYCTRSKAMKLWSKKPEDFDTPNAWKERAKKEMTGEVELCDIYIRDNIFGVVIEKCIATQEDLDETGDFTKLPDRCFKKYKSRGGFFYDQDGEAFIAETIGDISFSGPSL